MKDICTCGHKLAEHGIADVGLSTFRPCLTCICEDYERPKTLKLSNRMMVIPIQTDEDDEGD